MNQREVVTIQIGGVFASRGSVLIKTVLGSCIATCLRDPVSGIGGMNHFMLPEPFNGGAGEELSRYGVHAMELLIGNIQKLGGERERLQAKVFGGGHVLDIPESADGVPQQNIRFVQGFLQTEGIPLLAHDLGGRGARHIQFDTASGTVRLKRLSGLSTRRSIAEREHGCEAQRQLQRHGDITLFDE